MAETKVGILVEVVDKATAGLTAISDRLVSFDKNFSTATETSKKFATAFATGIGVAGAAAGAFAVKSIKDFSDLGDAVQKMSIRTGVSAQSISALRVAADMGGTSIEAVEKGLLKYTLTANEAIGNTDKFKDTFGKLGFTLQEVKNMKPDEAFAQVGYAISEIPSQMERTQLAIDLFGKSGTELLPLFSDMEEGLGVWQKKAQELGVSFTDLSANNAAQLNDALGEMHTAVSGLGLQVGGMLAPYITTLAEKVTDVVVRFNDWLTKIGGVQGAIDSIKKFLDDHTTAIILVAGAIAGALVPALISFAVTLWTVTIPAIAAMVIALAPFILGGLIIAGVIAGIVWVVKNFDWLKAKAIEIWTAIKEKAAEIWDAVTNTIMEKVKAVTDFVERQINRIKDLFDSVKNFGSGLVSGVTGAASTIGNAVGIHDGIVQGGRVITTDPDDYIIATKTPGSLGGGTVNVNINGGTYLSSNAARLLGDEILRQLQLQIRT